MQTSLHTKNTDFNAYMNFTKNMKFFVCDGNHRRIAWMNHITSLYSLDPKWHIMLNCIILETKGKIELVMQVMHDINK